MSAVSDLGATLDLLCDLDRGFEQATGMEPRPWQREYMRVVGDALILKGRQIGASTTTGFLCVRAARLRPGSTSLIVSPSLNLSKEVLQRARQQSNALGLRLTADSRTELQYENGSRLISLPGTPKAVRGYTASGILVIDEAAYLDPETYLAARAIAATGAWTRIQSTPAAPFGPFYQLWEGDDPSYTRMEVTSEEAGTHAPGFLEREKRSMTEEEYAQEYLGRFQTPGLGLVDPARLEALVPAMPKEGAAPAGGSVWDRLGAAGSKA